MEEVAEGDLVHEIGDVVHAFDRWVKGFSPAVDGVLDREQVLAWIASLVGWGRTYARGHGGEKSRG